MRPGGLSASLTKPKAPVLKWRFRTVPAACARCHPRDTRRWKSHRSGLRRRRARPHRAQREGLKPFEKSLQPARDRARVSGELLRGARGLSHPPQIRHKFARHRWLPGLLHPREWGTGEGGDRKGTEADLGDPTRSPSTQGDFPNRNTLIKFSSIFKNASIFPPVKKLRLLEFVRKADVFRIC